VARSQGPLALLQRHYDKLVALAALLLLLGAIAKLALSGVANRADATRYRAALDALEPLHPVAEPLNLAPYSNALVQLRRPFRIPIDRSERPVGFFVPEARVWCVSCRQPIPITATNCPYENCQAPQPGAETVGKGFDGDGGGIPDEDEIRYGLDPQNPADDIADSDGDGFTNLEEHLAGTDPKDPRSHPPRATRLRVKEIVATQLPLKFMGATKMPDGRHLCQINLTPRGETEPRTYFVSEGDQIGDTEFRLLRYVETIEKRPDPMIPGHHSEFIDRKVVLGRGKKEITLSLDKPAIDTDYRITLVLLLDGTTYEDLTVESVFTLRDETFRVVSVDSQTGTVVIRDDAHGKDFTIPKL
jgi:hypothetical protein